MNIAKVKRLIYGLTGAIYLAMTCIGLSLVTLIVTFASAMGETGRSGLWKINLPLSVYGFASISLLAIAIWRESLLLDQRKHYFLFLLAGVLATSVLVIDLLNDAQGFSFQHVLLGVSVVFLFHDFRDEVIRRKRLHNLTGSSN